MKKKMKKKNITKYCCKLSKMRKVIQYGKIRELKKIINGQNDNKIRHKLNKL